MLTDPEHVEADVLGEADLLEQVAHALLRADPHAVRVDLAERV